MGTSTNMLPQLGESLRSAATVKSVFGEPIRLEGRTVIPVARIAYGFGGGFGSALPGATQNATGHRGEGGGGGGGVHAVPAGALEITDKGTRFIVFRDLRVLAGAFAAGAIVGALLFRRRSIQPPAK